MQPLGMRVYLAAFSMFVSSLLGRSRVLAAQNKFRGISHHVVM